MRSILHSLLPLAFTAALCGAPHRLRIFPNANIVILGIAGDGRGDLWLAAEDGLYRFDGVRYQKIPGLPLDKIRYVGVTEDEAVWVGGPGGLARYDGGFRVIKKGQVTDFSVSPDHVLIRVDKALFRIGLDASITPLPFTPQGRPFSIGASGFLWQVHGVAGTVCSYPPEALSRPRQEQPCIQVPRGLRLTYALPDALGRIWVADENKAIHYEGERQVLAAERIPAKEQWRPGPLARGQGRRLWFIGETACELSSEISFRSPEDDQRYLPTAGYEDFNGSVWIADRGRGLVQWTQDFSWNRWFTEDFARQSVNSVIRTVTGTIVAASGKGLYRLDSDRWVAMTAEPWCCAYVFPEAGGTLLASLGGTGLARLSASGAILERPADSSKYGSFRKIVRGPGGGVWVTAKEGLFKLAGSVDAQRLIPVAMPGQSSKEPGVLDVKLDSKGRLWAGHLTGLARLDDSGRWTNLATDRPIARVQSLAFDGNGDGDDILIAYRQPGSFSRLRRDGEIWRVTDYPPENEYGSDDTRYFERDSRGWIWRGTMDGVYVSEGHGAEPSQWLHLNRQNGLSGERSADYGFFEDRDGSIWLAGQDGVSHIRPDPTWFSAPLNAPPPRITSLSIDGAKSLPPGPLETVHVKKSLHIDFGSAFTSAFRDQPFVYRLISGRSNQDPSWHGFTGSLDYRNLPTGRYALTVAYPGTNSPSTTLMFQVVYSLFWPSLSIVCFTSCALGWLLRNAGPVEKAKYRVGKWWFVLLGGPKFSAASATGDRQYTDYESQVLRGRYLIAEAISRSRFSVVYKAQDIRDGSRVAIKVAHPAGTDQGRSRDKFALEIAALQSIHHPGIVPILDWWINSGGEGCIAMPFLEGPTLRAALARPFPPRHAARVLRQLGQTLAEVHSRGIVHRDVKPENIILVGPDEGGQAVIVDFGAAGFRGAEDALAVTATHDATLQYMAPERLMGRYSPSSDVYSLGVIALEMLSGKRLYDLGATCSSALFQDELGEALGERQLIRAEYSVALPARPLIERLGGGVGEFRRERKANSASAPSVFRGRFEQRTSYTATSRIRADEQIVQDEDACHASGRKAGIQLREACRYSPIDGEKNHRLVALQTLLQEMPGSLGFARLAIEAAIGVKQGNERLQVRDRRPSDVQVGFRHSSLLPSFDMLDGSSIQKCAIEP